MRCPFLRLLTGHKLAASSPKAMRTDRLILFLSRSLASAWGLLLVLALAGLGTLPSVAQSAPPPSETSAARDARMQWWRDARFGMFVHWGLYSGLAGTWQGQPVGTTGGMEWIQERVKADTDSYARAAIPLFQPKPDFARDWARLAREAGCRYVVFTTKHHDGFALHDSKVSDFDAGSVLQRDLVREIVTALRAEGLRVGFYHSVIDWHHDQYEYALSKQLPHPLKGRPYPNSTRDHARYLDFLHAQVGELITGYGPIDILWWDYSSQDFQGDPAWRATELMAKVRAQHPDIIMNNRLYRSPEAGWTSMGTDGYVGRLDSRFGDFITPEQHIPDTGLPHVDWETCMTLNTTWGYSEHDHAWKQPDTLIRNLADIASKGGNYLLNIGPKADGTVPEESVRALQAMGAWMKVNRASIIGTSASPLPRPPWGRLTTKTSRNNTTLYLHVFDWPADGKLTLEGIPNPVRNARLLAGGRVQAESHNGTLSLSCPGPAPDPVNTVIAVRLSGPLPRP
jgi:alpha-L-fucosidase